MKHIPSLRVGAFVAFVVSVTLGLSSCANTPSPRRRSYYTEPASGPNTAEIIGSHQIGISLSGYSAYLSSVDGRPVEHASDWESMHRLAAGQHTIGIEYAHLGSHTIFEQVVEIAPRHQYRAAFAVKNGYHIALDQLKLWLEDNTDSKTTVTFFDGQIGDSTRVLQPP